MFKLHKKSLSIYNTSGTVSTKRNLKKNINFLPTLNLRPGHPQNQYMSYNTQNLTGKADEVYNLTNGIQGQELADVTFLQN